MRFSTAEVQKATQPARRGGFSVVGSTNQEKIAAIKELAGRGYSTQEIIDRVFQRSPTQSEILDLEVVNRRLAEVAAAKRAQLVKYVEQVIQDTAE